MAHVSFIADYIRSLLHQEDGQDAIEYMIVVAVVAVAIAGAALFAPGLFTDTASSVADKISDAVAGL
jgi:Flp pilus assembly pilin Flp